MKRRHFLVGIFFLCLGFKAVADSPVDAERLVSNAVATQSTNAIIVAGYVQLLDKTNKTFVTRFTSTGLVDTGFGTDGLVLTQTNMSSQVAAMVVDASDRIVAAGSTKITSDFEHTMVIRYASDGTLDTTFGTNGIATTSTGVAAIAYSVALASDEKIVIAGITVIDGRLHGMLARYEDDGALDTTFAFNGIAALLVQADTQFNAVKLQNDGRIIAAGYTRNSVTGIYSLLIARYEVSGQLDPTFGTNGTVVTTLGSVAQIRDIAIQADGKIVVLGRTDNDVALVRYTSDGILDTTFNSGGSTPGVVIVTPGTINRGVALVINSSGAIIIGGTFEKGEFTFGFIAKFDTAGALVPSFGLGGIAKRLVGADTFVTDMHLTAVENILIAGVVNTDGLIAESLAIGVGNPNFGFYPAFNIYPFVTSGSVAGVTFLRDSKISGSDGGTFPSGAAVTRDLNIVRGDRNKVSLLSNQFTLQPGLYHIKVGAPAYRVNRHQAFLFNVTVGQTVLEGTNAYAVENISSDNDQTVSEIEGNLIVPLPLVFEVRHACETTRIDDGFGVATGFGTNEVYTTVTIISK
ncbi:MAG: hypothetical protein WD068_03255 [Candidatus Babeliales bacterium]